MSAADRYIKTGRGRWRIRLVRKAHGRGMQIEASPTSSAAPIQASPAIITELEARGITPDTAARLAGDYPADRIAAQLDAFDFLFARKDKALSRNAPGWQFKAIRDGYGPPPGFVGKIEPEQRDQAALERNRQDEAGRQAKARAREDAARVRNYWQGLSLDCTFRGNVICHAARLRSLSAVA